MKPIESDPTIHIGDCIDIEAGPMVHGGHCIAHAYGRTIFVRGALPKELVRVTITEKRKKVYFARVIEVLSADSKRVTPPCKSSTDCGGCDFQFIQPEFQLELKTRVLSESLLRFSGLSDCEVDQLLDKGVRPLPPQKGAGLNWRHKSRFIWNNGWKMHEYRSEALTSTPHCEIITEEMRNVMRALNPDIEGEYLFAHGDTGVSVSGPNGYRSGPMRVEHQIFGATWRLSPESFWQAHGELLATIADFIDQNVSISEGELWWDLFGGSGVFAAYLSSRVGDKGSIYSVESNHTAVRAGKRALHDWKNIHFVNSDVYEFVQTIGNAQSESLLAGVLLDPPRAGAGADLCDALTRIRPRKIIYVACDPVSLARDVSFLHGTYRVSHLGSWDAFPMSHHFECVAVLETHLS